MSLFLQVYGGCGLATLIGFLALCHISASRAHHEEPPQTAKMSGDQTLTH